MMEVIQVLCMRKMLVEMHNVLRLEADGAFQLDVDVPTTSIEEFIKEEDWSSVIGSDSAAASSLNCLQDHHQERANLESVEIKYHRNIGHAYK